MKQKQIRRFKLMYFASVNLNGMPESFLDKLDELYLQIENGHPQVNEALEFYENAIIDSIESLETIE